MKNLREMKVDELKDIARGYSIAAAWKMTKDKLIENILKSAKLNGHADLYFDGQNADPEPEETKIPEGCEATIIDGTLVAVSKTEDITETHEDASESIEAESNETNQEAQENESEMNVDDPVHAAAKANIENAYNWIIGGHGNALVDGEMTMEDFNEWLHNEAFDEILIEATTTKYEDGCAGGKAPSCMKKVTKEFCARYLLTLFKADNYNINPEIKPAQKGHGAPKRGALLAYNGKEQNICAWGKELGISPNTLYGRIYKMGWTIEKAFTTPARTK